VSLSVLLTFFLWVPVCNRARKSHLPCSIAHGRRLSGIFPLHGSVHKKSFCPNISTRTKAQKLLRYHLIWHIKNTPSLHTHHHALSLDNGRKSRWTLLKSFFINRLFAPTFPSPFHVLLNTAIPPPAALCESPNTCTPLGH